jgi:hypothetical protein
MAIPMDVFCAQKIHSHMVAWYLHASCGVPEETPPPLTYSLGEMVEAAATVREQPKIPNKAAVLLDDRAVAALYVIHHFKHSPNDSEGDPILKFPSPNSDGIRALLFLEFKTKEPV